MTPDRWQQIEDVFARASELTETVRERFLAATCGADRELRVEVESLLASSPRANAALRDVIASAATDLERDRLQPGSVVDERFEIEAVGGSGGMAQVFRARDRRTGEPVALKILARSHADELPRFVREARVLAELEHPAIVRYIARGETAAGDHYLVMSWVDGSTLAERLARGALAVADAVALVRAIAEALAAVHAAGVVHRDVKPGNIILEAGDLARPRLVDFGVARVADPAMAMTRTGHVLGTPSYMAPEQIRGERDLDARADVFALGCVLFECVTGKPAFSGTTARAVLAKVLFDEPRFPEHAGIPGELARLMASMLDKQATHRPQDAAEVAARLGRISFAPVPAGVERDALPALPGFEVVRRIGRGGSSDVFEAVRVGAGGFRKPVALKQLADEGLAGKARERFFEEARLSAQLEHPNLVRVADVITAGTRCFIVMDLLRGANLAEAAAAVRDWPIALSIAEQVLDGLAYAHAGGEDRPQLVHRDLTPRNVFACSDGTVKILDFGIAKRQDGAPLTTTGHIHGTLAFLSPEQARGERVDARSDLYQLGATLYWLLSGTFPHGEAVAAGEIIARIASGRVAPLGDLVELPAAVCDVIDRAMATAPGDRFADAAEMHHAVTAALAEVPVGRRGTAAIARALGGAATAAPSARRVSSSGRAPASRRRPRWIVVVAAAVIAFAGGLMFGRDRDPAPVMSSAQPAWTQLTFGRARIGGARFAPDGKTFVFAVTGHDGRMSVYQGEPGNTLGRALGLADTDVLAVSRQGDLLVMLQPRVYLELEWSGTLATVPLAGGAPRELVTDVTGADVGPDGRTFAVSRRSFRRRWIEFPLGRTLVHTDSGWYSNVRISPRGDRIAFIDHPARGDDAGVLTVIGADSEPHQVGPMWGSVLGLAWAGDEIWLTGASNGQRAVVALHPDARGGSSRLLASAPSRLRIADVTDGRALVLAEELRIGYQLDLGDGHPAPIPPIGNLEYNLLSPDGRWLLGNNGWYSAHYQTFKMPVDFSAPPTLLGDGLGRSISPDGRWVVTVSQLRDRMRVLPLGPGQPIELPVQTVSDIAGVSWFPDGQRLLFSARSGTGPQQLHVIDLTGGPPRPFGRAGLWHGFPVGLRVAPDGSFAVVDDQATGHMVLIDLATAREVPIEIATDEAFVAWSPDSRDVLVGRGTHAFEISRVDIATGQRRPWKTFRASTPETSILLTPLLSPDPTRYILQQADEESVLYEVKGLH